MRVLHLSTYAGGSGAGRAAFSLHSALRGQGVESRMLVARSHVEDPDVSALSGASTLRWRLAQRVDRAIWNLQRSSNTSWRSPALFGVDVKREIDRFDPDVVNLHWVTNGFLAIEEIGRIDRPVVWSLYDMWPFSGTEHYGSVVDRTNFGYRRDNRPPGDSGIDIDRWAWSRKRRRWLQPIHVVAASTWLEQRARSSALMRDWPIVRIPHPVDSKTFHASGSASARSRWGLDPHAPTVVFLASAGLSDHRKGGDVLLEALRRLHRQGSDLQALIVGPGPAREIPGLPPIVWVDAVRDDTALQSIYAAASVVAVPSREDTLPLVALEAQMCGVPVVASDVGGLPDAIDSEFSGELVPVDDVSAFTQALARFLSSRSADATERIRGRAEALWSYEHVASQYGEVFARASSS